MASIGQDTGGEHVTEGHQYHFAYGADTVYANVAELIKQFFQEPGVVLDIGCGFGPLAETCRDLGLTYIGVDRDPAGLGDLAERGFECHEARLDDLTTLPVRLDEILRDRSLTGLLLLDVIEHLLDPAPLLECLRSFARRADATPLLVSVPNVTHFDVCAKLLQGRWDSTAIGILDSSHSGFYSPDLLDEVMTASGWRQVAVNDFDLHESDQHFPPDDVLLLRETPVGAVLQQLRRMAASGADTYQFVRSYVPGPPKLTRRDRGPEPFLTVLTRTQGTRLETLQETILCLCAQTDQDFEVLIVAHNVSPIVADRVRYLITSLSPSFAGHFRVILATGQGRCRPLNVGTAAARGRYVAILDDDDVVLANWVETFKTLASAKPGHVLRAVAAEQDVAESAWPDRSGYAPTSAVRTPFAQQFDIFDHLYENHSPPCSLAFPRSCFRDLGLSFDEGLPVLEDWDVLLHAALLCGVASSEAVTSIYRRWTVGTCALSLHSPAEWRAARETILGKLDRLPAILPRGSISRIRDLVGSSRGTQPSGTIDDPRNVSQQVARLQAELDRVTHIYTSSTSWRITKPVRELGDFVRRLRHSVRPTER
jgi:hypothetical protein